MRVILPFPLPLSLVSPPPLFFAHNEAFWQHGEGEEGKERSEGDSLILQWRIKGTGGSFGCSLIDRWWTSVIVA